MEFECVALTWCTYKAEWDSQFVADRDRLVADGWYMSHRASFGPKLTGGACIMRRPKDELHKLTEEKAQRLRAQVERDLMRDVGELREKVRVTAETLSRWYQFRCGPKDEPRMWTEKELVELMKRTWLVNPSSGQRMKEETNG